VDDFIAGDINSIADVTQASGEGVGARGGSSSADSSGSNGFGNGAPPQGRTRFDHAQALQHLQALGIDPNAAWFRSIRHRGGANRRRKVADLHGFNAAELATDNAGGEALYVIPNAGADTTVSSDKGAVSDADIATCRVVYLDLDTGTRDEQIARIKSSGLPEPSVVIDTGGKSLHPYWLLSDPITPEQWRVWATRAIPHCGADPQCKNPSRVMRLAGGLYIDKATGQPTGAVARIIHAPGHRYSLAELLASLPEPQQQPQQPTRPPPAAGRPATTAARGPGAGPAAGAGVSPR